jgi:hypothetical protein
MCEPDSPRLPRLLSLPIDLKYTLSDDEARTMEVIFKWFDEILDFLEGYGNICTRERSLETYLTASCTKYGLAKIFDLLAIFRAIIDNHKNYYWKKTLPFFSEKENEKMYHHYCSLIDKFDELFFSCYNKKFDALKELECSRFIHLFDAGNVKEFDPCVFLLASAKILYNHGKSTHVPLMRSVFKMLQALHPTKFNE